MITDTISDDQLKIRVHHIGGIGGCGPTEALSVFGKDVEWIIYDADESSLAASDSLQKENYTLINKCLGAANSKGTFYNTFDPSASSILPPAPSAARYTLFSRLGIMIWGEHARIVESVDIETDTLDGLVDNKQVPPVDFLSMDVQGAELDVMNGASSMLKSSIVGIVCEVEFTELYSGQPLFCDIQLRLLKDGFRFCDMFGKGYFNTEPYVKELQGKGFFTYSEALFLKNPSVLIGDAILGELSSEELAQNVIRCIKLAAVAVAFDRLGFALEILRRLHEKKLVSLEKLAEKSHCNYIKLLRDLAQAADIVEAHAPPLVYNFFNARAVKTKIEKAEAKKAEAKKGKIYLLASIINKHILLLRSVITRTLRVFGMKIIRKSIEHSDSRISTVFRAYGLHAIADKHDMRLAEKIYYTD